MPVDRIPLFSPVPNDKMFTPRPGVDVPVVELKANPSAIEAIAAWEAEAQGRANDLNCAVLLHYSAVPHFERQGPMLRVDYIPAVPPIAEPPV